MGPATLGVRKPPALPGGRQHASQPGQPGLDQPLGRNRLAGQLPEAGQFRGGGRSGQKYASMLQHGAPTAAPARCRRFWPRTATRRPANAARNRGTAPGWRPAARTALPSWPRSPTGPRPRSRPSERPDSTPTAGRPTDAGWGSPGYRSVRDRARWPRRRWPGEPPPHGCWPHAAIDRYRLGSTPATVSAPASDRAATCIGRRPRPFRARLRPPPCSTGRRPADRAADTGERGEGREEREKLPVGSGQWPVKREEGKGERGERTAERVDRWTNARRLARGSHFTLIVSLFPRHGPPSNVLSPLSPLPSPLYSLLCPFSSLL